jgi:hypothetical protein
MPTFRQRPLSWLFWSAAGALDVIALATDREAPWVDGLLLGQIIVLGAWLALGHSHRLARAAVFVVALGAIALPDYLVERRSDADIVWLYSPLVLGIATTIAVFTALTTATWAALGRKVFGPATPPNNASWRFPVVEIFGWMNVVAIAAIGVRHADFDQLAENPLEMAMAGASLMATSAVVALTLGDFRRRALPKGAVAIAWLALAAFVLVTMSADQPDNSLIANVFVAVWTLTQRLDNDRTGRQLPPPDSGVLGHGAAESAGLDP